ncbi:Clp protease ClpP [Mariniblastus sp.]|nr:Clp protease ClpP [Mariniblastus sp.]
MSTIQIFGPIDSDMLRNVRDDLPASGPVTVEISSNGGQVTTGIAIASMLIKYPGHVTTVAVGGVSSIASLIFLAGDDRLVESDAMIHYHGPHDDRGGNLESHEDSIEELKRAEKMMLHRYELVTNLSAAELKTRFKRDNFLDAEEALAAGFATSIVEASSVMASSGGFSAKAMVDRCVTALMTRNPAMARHTAYRQVFAARPTLRERLVDEENADEPMRFQTGAPVISRHSRKGTTPTEKKVNALVEKQLEANPSMSRSNARLAVYKANPKLRQQIVDEANP